MERDGRCRSCIYQSCVCAFFSFSFVPGYYSVVCMDSMRSPEVKKDLEGEKSMWTEP
jgi:hypothetical protein